MELNQTIDDADQLLVPGHDKLSAEEMWSAIERTAQRLAIMKGWWTPGEGELAVEVKLWLKK